MGVAENKRLLQHVYVEISKGNLEPLLASLADDIEWTIIGTTRLSGTYRGRQEVIDGIVRPLGEALDGHVAFTFEPFIGEDDYVVMRARGRGRAKSGRPYNNAYCIVGRIKDGKIHALTDYIDTALITSALFS
jgi:ketosteroid isomerase-like protein